jgi:broad specificity phosphatase PhoE
MGVVVLVRHGQASFGAEDYDVLSGTGLEQSRVVGRTLAAHGSSPSAVVHGALRRQRDTALAMAEAGGWSGSVGAVVDEGWDEFDHLGVVARGPGGGGDVSDVRAFQRVFEDATARWYAGEHDGDYDESWPSFVDRVRGALDRAFARDGVTVVVTSGGPIALVCATLVAPEATGHRDLAAYWTRFNTVAVNGAVTRVLEGSTGRRLLSFNEHSHLPRDLVTYR